jgi:pimeloyl-ACP methyl ester carboxylesterase
VALCGCGARERDTEGLVATPTGAVFARSRGSGPPLVLLHGLGDSSVGWRRIEDGLRGAGFRVTVWDALGAGQSEKPAEGDYRLVAHVERLGAVLDRLRAERVTLVAHSLGGAEALLYALDLGDRVGRLVLISPAAYPEGGWTGEWLWRSPVADALERIAPEAIADLALRMNFGDPARITAEDRATYAAEAARPGTMAAFVRQQQQLMPDPEQIRGWIARYPDLQMPALILWGTRDKILDPALGDRLCAALPRARLVRLEGVGHAAALEAPEAVLAEILAFLRS